MTQSSLARAENTKQHSELQNLTALSFAELTNAVTECGLPKFRAKQIWSWIWRHGVTDFQDMNNIAKPVRAELAKYFVITRPAVSRRQQSSDEAVGPICGSSALPKKKAFDRGSPV